MVVVKAKVMQVAEGMVSPTTEGVTPTLIATHIIPVLISVTVAQVAIEFVA